MGNALKKVLTWRQKLAMSSFLGKPSHIYQSHSTSRLVLHSAYLNSKNKPWSHSWTKCFHKSKCKQIQARWHIFQQSARPVMAKLIFYSSESWYCTSDSLTYIASPLSVSHRLTIQCHPLNPSFQLVWIMFLHSKCKHPPGTGLGKLTAENSDSWHRCT